MRKIISAFVQVLFFVIVCVATTHAQEPSATKSKPDSSSPRSKTDPPKNKVEQSLDEAKKNGKVVLIRCLENCSESEDVISSDIEVGHVKEQPEYPTLAARAHISGVVNVQLLIGFEGEVLYPDENMSKVRKRFNARCKPCVSCFVSILLSVSAVCAQAPDTNKFSRLTVTPRLRERLLARFNTFVETREHNNMTRSLNLSRPKDVFNGTKAVSQGKSLLRTGESRSPLLAC